MSINRDMEKYMLQVNKPVRGMSGEDMPNWCDIGYIDVAVYKKDDMRMFTSEKYKQSTHSGLTHCKKAELENGRLLKGGVAYLIISCNRQSRLTNLLLEVVDEYD